MECAVLTVEAESVDDLVRNLKSKDSSAGESLALHLAFDMGDKPSSPALLVFAGPYMRNQVCFVLIVFYRETKSTWRVVVVSAGAGEGMYVSTDVELRIVDRFAKWVWASFERAEIVYDSKWTYDYDEKLREKAVSALQQMDASIALKPLVNLLRHDDSDAIREKAAQSLGRIETEEAVNALQRSVDNYIHGDRSRHRVTAVCAEALGTMRNRQSLESLRQLLEIFEKKKLSIEATAVKKAIYRIEYGKDMQVGICIVCNQPVDEGSDLLQCPACKGIAHREHMLEWLHVKDYCPACRKHLDEESLLRPSVPR